MADPQDHKPELLISAVSNLTITPSLLSQLLRRYESILDKKSRREVYYYFLENIVATAPLIQKQSTQSEQAIYRNVRWLNVHGFINSHGKIKNVKKGGGPKPVLYALPGATSEQIARARIKIDKSYRQSHTLVLDLTQLLFEDVVDMQIQYSKIVSIAKKRCKGFDLIGISDQVARELHEKGIKIWR